MTAAIVVYVHGMWMPGEEMMFVKRRLEQQHDLAGHLFRYPSVRGTLDQNVARLAEFLAQLSSERIHLVGHSLGGVLALRMLSLTPNVNCGRVVCMGSPLCGSRAAELLYQTDWGCRILGKSIRDGVVNAAASEWASEVTKQHEIGCIAGTTPVGLGRLVAGFNEKNDGTVAVSETRLPGIKDHICLPVNHSGMVFSSDAADQAAAFLQRGEFLREGSQN